MKHFLKGAAVMAVVIIVNMIINIVCNMNGVDLNSTVMSTTSAVGAVLVYNAWIKGENDKDAQQ